MRIVMLAAMAASACSGTSATAEQLTDLVVVIDGVEFSVQHECLFGESEMRSLLQFEDGEVSGLISLQTNLSGRADISPDAHTVDVWVKTSISMPLIATSGWVDVRRPKLNIDAAKERDSFGPAITIRGSVEVRAWR